VVSVELPEAEVPLMVWVGEGVDVLAPVVVVVMEDTVAVVVAPVVEAVTAAAVLLVGTIVVVTAVSWDCTALREVVAVVPETSVVPDPLWVR
jgi:hypothetical protein